VWAVPFALDRLEVTGEPFLIGPGGSQPSVADDGTLVYQEGSTTTSLRLTWNDREGREIADAGAVAFQGGHTFPAVAPDGQRLCASVHDAENPDLWVFVAARGTRTRLTFGSGREEFPSWSPAGDVVYYHVRPTGSGALADIRVVLIAADGTGRPDTVAIGLCPVVSPDGRYVTYARVAGVSDWDLMYRPVGGERGDEAILLQAPGLQYDARVAPGGGYVAYVSNESGTEEIFLTRFPSGQGRWQVSVGGGQWPRWNRRGDRLCYVNGDDVMEVELALGASPTLGTPRRLFTRPAIGVPTIAGWDAGFDVTADGGRFAFFRDPPTGIVEHEMIVVQNWIAEFRERR
jgi:Tol biopolymer transport system component